MSLSHSIVKLAFQLERSERYHKVKGFFYNLLENPQSSIRPYFDSFMILLVLASVFVLIIEVRSDLGVLADLFEWFVVTLFVIEYLLRFWLYNDVHQIILDRHEEAEFLNTRISLRSVGREVASKKWEYMTSPMAIIDLLAIIPSYRPLRFLRIFLLFRLFKLFRYTRSVSEFLKVLTEKRTELVTLAIFLAFLLFISATTLYFFEVDAAGSDIHNLFDGIYLSLVTLSTVGYGDLTPHTTEGRLVTMVLIVVGLGFISFFTSIIVSAFNEKMHDIQAQRVFSEVERKGHSIIICGYGRVGQEVAGLLANEQQRFVVIDPVAEHVFLARRQGFLAVQGKAEDDQLLESVGISTQAKRILCLTSDDVANLYITLSARQLNPDIEIISRANRGENVAKLLRAGANHAVAPYQVVARVSAAYVGQPVAFEAVYDITSGQKEVGMELIRVHAGSPLDGATLGDINFRQRRMILFGVVRGEGHRPLEGRVIYQLKGEHFYFNPESDLRLQGGDMVVLFGHNYSINHFRAQLARGEL